MSFAILLDDNLFVESLFTILISNDSDVSILPEVMIEKINGDGHVKIININTSQIFQINDMMDGETVYIDNDKEIITPNVGYVGRFNKQFLYLIRGVNNLRIDGSCRIKFRYRHRYLPQTGGGIDAD